MKDAINDGIHPKMISKGSSGSYFARAKMEGKVQTVAYANLVFVWLAALTLSPVVYLNRKTKSLMVG